MSTVYKTKMYKLMGQAARHFRTLQEEARAITATPEIYEENKELFKELDEQIEVLASFCIFHLEKVLCSLDEHHKMVAHNELHSIYEQIGQILNEKKDTNEATS